MRDYSKLPVSLRCCISDSEPCEHCNCELEECNPKIIMEIAADAIEELLKEVQSRENDCINLTGECATYYAQIPKWISVDERLPEDREFVLFWLPRVNSCVTGNVSTGSVRLDEYGVVRKTSLLYP